MATEDYLEVHSQLWLWVKYGFFNAYSWLFPALRGKRFSLLLRCSHSLVCVYVLFPLSRTKWVTKCSACSRFAIRHCTKTFGTPSLENASEPSAPAIPPSKSSRTRPELLRTSKATSHSLTRRHQRTNEDRAEKRPAQQWVQGREEEPKGAKGGRRGRRALELDKVLAVLVEKSWA